MTNKYTLIILCAFSVIASAGEVFPGRNPDLPAASVLEQGWDALVNRGDIGTAQKLFESADRDLNGGPSLFMGLETVYNFQNRFSESIQIAAQGFRASKDSPWAEIFLYDVLNLRSISRDISPAYLLLKEAASSKGVPFILRDYARFELAKTELKRGKAAQGRELLEKMQFIKRGIYCGPFPNRDGSGFHKTYPPEQYIRLEEEYPGINRNVGWFKYETPQPDRYIDFSAMFYPFRNAVAYGLYGVYVPEKGEHIIHAGTGNSLRIWVNYTQVFSTDRKNSLFFDRYMFRASMVKGWNIIAVKLGTTETDDDWGLYLRVSCSDGSSVKGLRSDFISPDDLGSGIFSGRSEEAETIPSPAERFFASVISDDPENSVAYGTLGFVYSQRSKGDSSEKQDLKLYEKALTKAPLCPLWGELAGSVNDDINRTLQVLRDLTEKNPGAVSLKEKMCSILFSRGFNRAFEDRLGWFAAVPEERLGYIHYMRASLYRARGWRAEAARYFRKSAEHLPHFRNAYIASARIARSLDEKVKCFESLLAYDRTDAYAHESLGFLAHHREDIASAEQHYRNLITYHPSSLKGYFLLSDLYIDADDPDRALEVLAKAEKMFPQYPSVKEEQGKILIRTGKREEGTGKIREALAIDPNLIDLQKYLGFLSPGEKEFYAEWDFSGPDALQQYKGDSAYTDHNSVDIKSTEIVRVFPNGTENRMVHKLSKALTDTGVQRLSAVRIPYSTSRNRVDIKHAHIIKPDGRIIQAGRVGDYSGVRTTSGGAALYSSYHVKTIRFPGLEKGDCVDYQYVVHDTSPDLFTDEFSDMSFLVSLAPAGDSNYIVEIPKDMKLHAGTFNTEIRPEIKSDDDTNMWIYTWHISSWPGIILEKSMRPLTEYVPHVILSTIQSWKEVGEWYSFLIRDQAHLNADMKNLVADRIQGLESDTQKAEAIFSYVRDEIRYVGIEFGRNSMKPHRAQETFATGYGDCKDTAVLLRALLAEAGIGSRVVLVRTQDRGKIGKNVASPYIFNHAVCMIPDLEGRQVWLDGTTDYYRMEEIPWADQNGFALVVDGPRSSIMVIPEEEKGYTGARIEASIELKPDGSAYVDITEYFTGQRAPALQRYLSSPDRFRQMIERLYAGKFSGFDMDAFDTSPSDRIEKEPWYRIKGTVKRYGLKRGSRIVCASSLNPLSLSGKLAEKARTYPLWLKMKTYQDEKLVLTVPEGYRISFYPEESSTEIPFCSFTQTFSLEKKRLSVHTKFAVTETTIPPSDYGRYRKFCAYVDSTFEERIICEKE